jgi:hypothetical protein
MIFLRSAVMAEKLLALGDEYKARTGRAPKIGFNVGAGHSNIEDLLQAGRDVCRGAVLLYPTSVLRELTALNGGIEDFCSVRIFQLPENLTVDESPESRAQKLSKVTGRRAVDTELAQALGQKISVNT